MELLFELEKPKKLLKYSNITALMPLNASDEKQVTMQINAMALYGYGVSLGLEAAKK